MEELNLDFPMEWLFLRPVVMECLDNKQHQIERWGRRVSGDYPTWRFNHYDIESIIGDNVEEHNKTASEDDKLNLQSEVDWEFENLWDEIKHHNKTVRWAEVQSDSDVYHLFIKTNIIELYDLMTDDISILKTEMKNGKFNNYEDLKEDIMSRMDDIITEAKDAKKSIEFIKELRERWGME